MFHGLTVITLCIYLFIYLFIIKELYHCLGRVGDYCRSKSMSKTYLSVKYLAVKAGCGHYTNYTDGCSVPSVLICVHSLG